MLLRKEVIVCTWQHGKVGKTTYPTIDSTINEPLKIYLSGLPNEDKRLGSAYEVEYGFWIRGDPFEALKGIILFGNFNETDGN